MAKEKMTVTIDPAVLAHVDSNAAAAGLNRSEYVERALRHDHYRHQLAQATPASLPDGDERQLRSLLAWQQNPTSGQAAAA